MTNSEIKCEHTVKDVAELKDIIAKYSGLSQIQSNILAGHILREGYTRTPEPRPVAIAFDKVRKEKISITYINFTEGVFLENDNSYTRPISELDISQEPTNADSERGDDESSK